MVDEDNKEHQDAKDADVALLKLKKRSEGKNTDEKIDRKSLLCFQTLAQISNI